MIISIKLYKTIGTDSNGEEIRETKTYIAPNPKAVMIRRAAQLAKKLDAANANVDDLEIMANYVVELFGYKFTADELWEGIAAEDFASTVIGCIKDVMGALTIKLSTIPNVPAE